MNDFQVIIKPWGREEIWANEDEYVGKFLHINAGHKLSKQFHNIKKETITVLSGSLYLEINDKEFVVSQGKSMTIFPKTVHRFAAKDEDVVLLEVSTNHLSDVVRLQDDYNRA